MNHFLTRWESRSIFTREEHVRHHLRFGCVLLFLAFFSSGTLRAQAPPTSVTDANATGNKPFGTYAGSDIDNIDLNNGAVNIQIPLFSKKGRGLDFAIAVTYSSKIWVVGTKSTADGPIDVWKNEIRRGGAYGWAGGSPILTSSKTKNCALQYQEKGFVFQAFDGAKHTFENQTPNNCYGSIPTAYSEDSTSMKLVTGALDGFPTLTLPNGTNLYFNKFIVTTTAYNYFLPDITDSNGNKITSTFADGGTNGQDVETWTDTLGRTVAILRLGPPSQTAGKKVLSSISVWDSDGIERLYTFSWQLVTPTCNFQYPTCAYYVPFSGAVLTQLTLPNGKSYTFSYANQSGVANPFGELMKVTLPTGGYIRYEYATLTQGENGGQDGRIDSRVVTKRVVSPDGSTEHSWVYNYGRTGGFYVTGKTTTVTDPQSNQTVYNFQEPAAGLGFFEARRDLYQGASTLLRTVEQQWQWDSLANGKKVNPRVWLRKETLADITPNKIKQTTFLYDSFTENGFTRTKGNVTELAEYGYGDNVVGPLLRRTVSTYLTDTNYHTRQIWDRLTRRQVYDGGGNLFSDTINDYDLTSIATTSGAVQRDLLYGASYTYRGNVSETRRWRSTDGAWLPTTFWYNDLGNLIQTQDSGNQA